MFAVAAGSSWKCREQQEQQREGVPCLARIRSQRDETFKTPHNDLQVVELWLEQEASFVLRV